MKKKWIQLVICSALLLFATVDGFGCEPDLGTVTVLNCSSSNCYSCGWVAYASCTGSCPCGYPNCKLGSGGQIAVGMSYDCYLEGSNCMCSNTDGEVIYLNGHCGCFNI